MSLNAILESLGKELRKLSKVEETRLLSQIAVEGLDAILQTLIDLAHAYSDIDMDLLSKMTSENGQGLSNIRQHYLGDTKDLEAKNKAVLISATIHMDQLRSILGKIGSNYQRLAIAPVSG